MRELEVSLIEWPEGVELGGPRLLGRSSDPDLIQAVRERIAADRRRALAEVEPPVRLVKGSEPPEPPNDRGAAG